MLIDNTRMKKIIIFLSASLLTIAQLTTFCITNTEYDTHYHTLFARKYSDLATYCADKNVSDCDTFVKAYKIDYFCNE